MLTVFAVLAAVLTPEIGSYVEDAKLVRASSDVSTVAISLIRLSNDVGPEGTAARGWASFDLLVGAGGAPTAGTPDAEPWTARSGAPEVGLLDDHLVTTEAQYTEYRYDSRMGGAARTFKKSVGVDPWGRRYAVNVRAMRTSRSDTVVLSAGPDGIILVPFEGNAMRPAGDGITALVAPRGAVR